MGWIDISAQEAIVIVSSYFLGCFCAGYYLVKMKTGKDIRQSGSGNLGARNVGRSLGTFGYGLTLFLDALKGAIPVMLAIHLNFSPWVLLLTMQAVIAGHIWPVQLGFRGGKGFATMVGVLLAYDFKLFFVLLALAAGFALLSRRTTLSGLVALSLAPVIVYFDHAPTAKIFILTCIAVLIVYAHRSNVRSDMKKMWNISEK